MANIVKRGEKGAPRFYVQFVVGRTADGKRLQRMHLLKGVETLPQAKQQLARVEREVAAGRDPFAVVVNRSSVAIRAGLTSTIFDGAGPDSALLNSRRQR